MKKWIRLFLLIVLPLFVLMGCGNTAQDVDNDGYVDISPLPAELDENDLPGQALIGHWTWDEDDSYIYIFHDGGTGRRGDPADRILGFTWRVENDMLHLDITGGDSELWRYAVTGNILTMAFYGDPGASPEFQGFSFTYTRSP